MPPALRSVPTQQTGSPLLPAAGALWPIPGDAPDLEIIIADQAATMAAQADLIDAYQTVLETAQAPVPGTVANGTAAVTTGATTSVTVNGVTGTIVAGATVADTATPANVPAGTKVQGQISGTSGGAGVYLFNNAVTFTATDTLTFTPPPTASSWPPPTDAPTLNTVQQDMSAVIRLQTALLQAYQDLLNDSQTPAPATGP